MLPLKVFLFGAPRVERGNQSIHIQRRKGIALLAYLCVTRQPHSRETLSVLFWPEADAASALANLRRELARLKEDLGAEIIQANRQLVRLNPDTGLWVDAVQFETLAAAVRDHPHSTDVVCPDCISRLNEAVELYTGDFMAGFSLADRSGFNDWLFFYAENMRRTAVEIYERLARWQADLGEYPRAISAAHRWLALDPYSEPCHRALMNLYARSGDWAAASRQFEECERLLQDELGASPGEETLQLLRFVQNKQFSPPQFPPPSNGPGQTEPAMEKRIEHLPAQLTAFIGRKKEIRAAEELITYPGCRLLTLTGPGGIGKTRLAVQLAETLLRERAHLFPDGVFFVSLAGVSSPPLITHAIASALGAMFYKSSDSLAEQLVHFLQKKSALLVLDDFDHLIGEESANLLTRILTAASGVKMIVTSRALVNAGGEYAYAIAGLEVPATGDLEPWVDQPVERIPFSGVQLFYQAARRVRQDFQLTAENILSVARICQLVEGMPLGIELAAAWLPVMPPEEIVKEIEHSLDFLETNTLNIPERQRSMRAVVNASWNLLDPAGQSAVQKLSIFRDCFNREMAQQVCEVSPKELLGLIQQSWVSTTDNAWYSIHGVQKQYAFTFLQDNKPLYQAVRGEYTRFFCRFLAGQEQELKGANQQQAIQRIEEVVDDIRTAWLWAVEDGFVQGIDQALFSLCIYHDWRGQYHEGEEACQAAVVLLLDPAAVGPAALLAATKALAWQSRFTADLKTQALLFAQCQSIFAQLSKNGVDYRQEQALVGLIFGFYLAKVNLKKTRAQYRLSLKLFTELGDLWGRARALYHLGWTEYREEGYKMALWQLRQSLKIQEQLGDHWGRANTIVLLGLVLLNFGQFNRAEQMLREGLNSFKQMDAQFQVARKLSILSRALFWNGKYREAKVLARQSLSQYHDLGVTGGHDVRAYRALAEAHLHLGEYDYARSTAQEGLQLARQHDFQEDMEAFQFILVKALLFAYHSYQTAGLGLPSLPKPPPNQANAAGLHWIDWGYAALIQNRFEDARQIIKSVLQRGVSVKNARLMIKAFPAAALLLEHEGQYELALEVYAHTTTYGYVAKSRWFESLLEQKLEAAAASLPEDTVRNARSLGLSLDLWQMGSRLLENL